MKVALRVISIWLAVLVLPPFLLLAWHVVDIAGGRISGLDDVARVSLVFALLIGFMVLGVFASHRLWHLKRSGLAAAALVFGGLLSVIVIVSLTSGRSTPMSTTTVILQLIPLIVVMSPQARRACA